MWVQPKKMRVTMWSLWTVFLFCSLSAAHAPPSKSPTLWPRFANTSSPPNPCLDNHFKAPEYELANLSVYSSLGGPFTQWWTKTWSYATFTLRDVANNYTLSCNMSSTYAGSDWSRDSCGPDTYHLPNRPRALTLLNALEANSSVGTMRLVQYWYCETSNASYPQLYQARATFDLNVNCVWHGETDPSYPCTVKTKTPLRFTPQWQPTGPLPDTPELKPNPSPPPPKPSGVSPLPARDCTDASFTNPEWTITNLTLDNEKTEFHIASRATGSTAVCSGAGGAATCRTTKDDLHSQSEFAVRFDSTAVNITHNWICGDTKGLYSTKFTATGSFPRSTSTTRTNSSTTVRGRLVQPVDLRPAAVPVPPGANNAGCLAKSRDPNYKVWTVHRFYFEITQNNWAYTSELEGSGSVPWNRTLQLELENHIINYTQTCDIRDPDLHDPPRGKWFPCFMPPGAHDITQKSILTYVQIDKQPRNFTLRINQTWFCNDDASAGPVQITSLTSFHSITQFYKAPESFSPSICGRSSHTAYDVVCGFQGFIVPVLCDVTFSAEWCVFGDLVLIRPPVELSPSLVPGNGNPLVVPLPPRSLDPFPDPDPDPDPDLDPVTPTAGGKENLKSSSSCTVASLGRGPIVWTLSQASQTKYFALSRWFTRWNWLTDQFATRISFSLASTVLPPGITIPNIGVSTVFGDVPSRITPWVHGWDPTKWYTDSEALHDGGGATGMGFIGGKSWDDLGILGWKLRVDLSTGYLEVDHAWSCTDKDPSKPVVFTGSWRGVVPLKCRFRFGGVEMISDNQPSSGVVESEDDRKENGIFCSLVGGEIKVVPEVTYQVVEGPLKEGYRLY